MQDLDLQIATNQRATIAPHATNINSWLLPSLASPNYLDLQVASDVGRGKPMFVTWRVATAFTGDALNWLRPAIFVDDTPTFVNVLTNPSLVICQGPQLFTSALIAGVEVELAVPRLNTAAILSVTGKRYMGFGYQAFVPTTDWSAGGIDCWVQPFPGRVRPFDFAAGW